MPYRIGEPGCEMCGELATSSCQRCGRPLCSKHAHGPDERCPRCEQWYEEHCIPGRRTTYPLEIPSRAARIILCCTPIWPFGIAAILKEAEKKRRRRRFLRERLTSEQ